jgi:glycosyltransferase involved in cell wall biosynthesis
VSTVLVLSAEPVGPVMAGPAIRALELSRALAAAGHDVTLTAPAPSVSPPGLRLLEASLADYDVLLGAIREHAVVVAQLLPPRLLARIASEPVRLVADLYNPAVVEVEEAIRHKSPASRQRLRTVTRHAAAAHLAAADLALCASERQAGLWRGIDPATPIAVVPFGVSADAPQPGRERRLPGEGRALLWNGGIWEWLDAPTVIAAMDHLPDDVHLVFLGTDRPAMLERDRHRAGTEAQAAASDRVHFRPGWVPYAERGSLLLEADVIVSAHPLTDESRYAFRTRLLDAFWAGRPVVCTEGDVLADLVAAEGIGATVAPGDPEAFAAAVLAVLETPPPAERIAAVAERFRWDRIAEPLSDFCATGSKRSPTRRRTRDVARHTRAQMLPLALETLATDGAGAAAARIARNAARVVR